MFAYCLLACLAVGAVSADPTHRVTCEGIDVQKDVSIASLGGNWVAVESLEFKDGHSYIPENDRRPTTCLYVKDSEASETGMTVKIDFNVAGKDRVVDTSTLTVVGDEKARLSLHSDINNRDNWEFLIIDSDPSKYLVYALCLPPNEAGERLPVRVNLLSRHADHSDHEVITADEELNIERKIGEKLHLTGSGVKPVRFNHDCWASYAEPQ